MVADTCLGAKKGQKRKAYGGKEWGREGRRISDKRCAIWTNASNKIVLLGESKGGNA